MLVKILSKRNFFIQILIILLFFSLGVINLQNYIFTETQLLGLSITVLTIAYVLYIDYKNEVISKNCYTTWFYMLTIMPFTYNLLDFKLSGSLLLFTYVVYKMIFFETKSSSKFEAFDIGFFLSFAVILSPDLMLVGLVIYVFFLSLKEIDPTILVLATLGFLFPILTLIQIGYLMDFNFLIEHYKNEFYFDFYQFSIKHLFLIPGIIIYIVSFINYKKNINKETIETKRIMLLVYLISIALIITTVLYGGKALYFIVYLAILLMIIFSKYLMSIRPELGWYKETILWVYLISMLFFNFYDRIPRIFTLITEIRL